MATTAAIVLILTVATIVTGRALGEAFSTALLAATGKPLPDDSLTRTQKYYRAMRFRDQLIDEWRLRHHARLLALEGPRRDRRDAHVEIALLCLDAEEIDVMHTMVYKAVRDVVGQAMQSVRDDSNLPSVEELAAEVRRRVLPDGHPRRAFTTN